MKSNASNPVQASTEVPLKNANHLSWPLLAVACGCSCLAMAFGFWIGNAKDQSAFDNIPPVLASSAASSETMAIATGPISDDAEGIFFLDFITGDLQCLVYYPRQGTFGARFGSNIAAQFGGAGKNSQYMMVTGGAVTKSSTGGTRPGASLVYVTDATKGVFAAYAVPWDRNAASSGRSQARPLVYAGGGSIRNFQIPNANQNPPAAIVDPNQKP